MDDDTEATDVEDGGPARAGNGSAVDQIIEAINRLISEKGLGVGDLLPTEVDLAKRFGTSRNTVREAMRTLRAYGILETRQKVGAVLIDNRQEAAMRLYSYGFDISAEIFTDIQDFRRLIEEGIASRVLANASGEDLIALETHTEEMERAQDISKAALCDFAFHRHIVGLAGNRTTDDVYGIMRPVILRLMESGKRERNQRRDIAREHRSIIDAIRQRDEMAYVYLIRSHLKSGMQFIEGTKTTVPRDLPQQD